MTFSPLSRRRLVTAACLAAAIFATPALAASAPLAPEDQALVDRATGYLEGLGDLKGRFEQTDARGGVTRGDLYLSRPGRARFAYDPPYSLLMVSDGRTVWVTDPRLKTVNHYPLKRTPLALFLADHVRFDHGVRVERVDRFSDGFAITATDGRHFAQGHIQLTFSDGPIRLREWSLTDAEGRTIRVRLTELESAPGLEPGLFTGQGGSEPPATQP